MRLFLITLCLFITTFAFSQRHDYFWKTGYGSYPQGTINGGVDIDFNSTPPDTAYQYREIDFGYNSATICDAHGNILFSSNGCVITGADDLPLLNGENLNPGYYYNEFCDTDLSLVAYPTLQDIFFLPHPADTNRYYLIHAGLGYTNAWGGMNQHVYYSLLDKQLDGGRGDVVEKNVSIVEDTMSLSSLSAVRHGNGQDWWIITNEQATDNYIFIRLDEDGFYESHRQAIGGFDDEDGATGQNTFSPDGNWFARFGRNNGLILYRFNRCEGSLHSPLFDGVPQSPPDSLTVTGGVAFSPDSPLLYLVTNLWIYQYDLWEDDIIGSRQRVATWAGDTLGGFFQLPQLGPDGKIYISAINTIPYLHVIEHPNERGYACEVNQLGFALPARNGLLIPYFPNYRLGALGPGGCDSLPTATTQPELPPEKYVLSISPNPARDMVSLSFSQPVKPEDEIVFRDIYGRALLRQAASHLTIDLSHLPPGLYLIEWYKQGQLVDTQKLICR